MIILILQSTWKAIEIGIATIKNESSHILCSDLIDKHKSALLVIAIETLLKKANLNFFDISLCVVNKGPAPFTTLRTIIATANGFKSAHNVPLYGVDGLKAVASEYREYQKSFLFLMNAYANELYFYSPEPFIFDGASYGYASINTIIEKIKEYKISIIAGSGTEQLTNYIKNYNISLDIA